MSYKKIRDIVARTGEYQDGHGKSKGRYVNAGSLLYNHDDKSYFILLKRTFNPAGLPASDKGESDAVVLSCFDPERSGGKGSGSYPRQLSEKGGDQSNQYGKQSSGYSHDLDDPVPF
ncbi:MAG: hypothetical protein JSC189_000740 [Candidatus Tokpelaia sp. JSC189]|nr:MAG: hypothetical protein JSC189_000740 [Candidatus Tokpelaia sp. JSC189]